MSTTKPAADAEQWASFCDNLGSVAYLSINLSNTDLTGKMLLTGFLEANDLSRDSQGNFVVRLGGEPQPKNWLPLPPSAHQKNSGRRLFSIRPKPESLVVAGVEEVQRILQQAIVQTPHRALP